MADRFYCPTAPIEGRATLEGDEARHLARVRRVAVGAVVELFDGRGTSYQAEVVELGRDRVDLAVTGPSGSSPMPALRLTLATAVPKGDRFDWLVEKATELGVSRLVPLSTERSTVDPRSAKLDRLRRAVVEASKQCRRDLLMELAAPMSWDRYVDSEPAEIRLIAHPGGGPIASTGAIGRGGSVALAIGPEGGFTPAEVDRAGRRGWMPVGLGPNTLRVETAAMAGSAVLLARAEMDARKGDE